MGWFRGQLAAYDACILMGLGTREGGTAGAREGENACLAVCLHDGRMFRLTCLILGFPLCPLQDL